MTFQSYTNNHFKNGSTLRLLLLSLFVVITVVCCFLLLINALPLVRHWSFFNQDDHNYNDKNVDIDPRTSIDSPDDLQYIVRPKYRYMKDGNLFTLQSITIEIPYRHLTMVLKRNDQLVTANYRHIYQNAQGNLVRLKKSNSTVNCFYHGLIYSWPHLNVGKIALICNSMLSYLLSYCRNW